MDEVKTVNTFRLEFARVRGKRKEERTLVGYNDNSERKRMRGEKKRLKQ